MIVKIRRWVGKNGEVRVYVNTDTGLEGCRYVTGNGFQAKNTVTGSLTKADWKEATKLGHDGQRWHDWYPTTSGQTSVAVDEDQADAMAHVDAKNRAAAVNRSNNSSLPDYAEGD